MSQSPNPAMPQPVAPLLALATSLLRAGRPADAIAPLRDAALLEPSNAFIQHDLGLACLEVGRVPEAIAALQQAIASNPRYADAYFRLGISLEKMGNMREAIAAYDRATELLPSLSEAWFRAGALVYILGHLEEAMGCFRRAAATGGRTSFGRLGKARALLIEDRNQEAEKALRETLVADPRNALAYDLLGNLLSEFGRFDEARACFERVIAIAPVLAGCYYELVRCRPVTSNDDGLLQGMQAALATPGLEAGQCLRIHLAIGKAAEDLGDYGLAMQHFDSADSVRRGFSSFDSAAFSSEVDRLIARCTPELIARASEPGSSDATPVLIIGMPRSGTTLVEHGGLRALERRTGSKDRRRGRVTSGLLRRRCLVCQPNPVELPSGRRPGLRLRQCSVAEWSFAGAYDRRHRGCGKNPDEYARSRTRYLLRWLQFAEFCSHQL